MKKTIALLLAFILCLSLCACGSKKVEGKGYRSPEEALIAYAEALKAGDVNKILSTFAVETKVENYSLENQIEEVRAYYTNLPLENEDDFTIQVNVIARQNEIISSLKYMYLNFAIGEEKVQEVTFTLSNSGYADAEDLVDDLVMEDWMKTLSQMKIGEIAYLEDVVDEDLVDRTEEHLEKLCRVYGCDEIVPLAVEVKLDGRNYYLTMNVANYNGKWFNLNQGGILSSIMGGNAYSGGLIPQ